MRKCIDCGKEFRLSIAELRHTTKPRQKCWECSMKGFDQLAEKIFGVYEIALPEIKALNNHLAKKLNEGNE